MTDDTSAEEEIDNPVTNDLLHILAGVKPRGKKIIAPTDSAIVPSEDGSLLFKTFKLTKIGIITDGAAIDDWRELGGFLTAVEKSLQWLIGDWIVMGETVYGQTYAELSALTGYAISTLTDYAYVARNVEFSMRIENLSFTHHQIIVAMPPDEQRYWLSEAAANGWSTAELRRAIKDNAKVDSPALPHDVKQARTLATVFAKGVTRMTDMEEHERAAFRVQAEKLRDHCNRVLQWLEDQVG